MKVLIRCLIIAMCVIVCATDADGRRQRTSRGRLELKKHETAPSPDTDTIYAPIDSLRLSGYEKAQSSTKESFFVTNNTGYTIKAIDFTIDYLDLKQRQLNRLTHSVKCNVPPGQTRSIAFRSWDLHHVWYYVNSQGRHNKYCNPFDVKIHINHIVVAK